MTTMIREVYEALREAGVSEEKAAKAAEAVEEVRDEDRLRKIDDRLSRVEQSIVEVKGDLTLVKWMLGFVLALNSAVLLKLILT